MSDYGNRRTDIREYDNDYTNPKDAERHNRRSSSKEPIDEKPLSASDITAIAESTVNQLLMRDERRSRSRRSRSPDRRRGRSRERSRSRDRRSRSRERQSDKSGSMSRLEKLKDPRIVTLKGLKSFHKEGDIRRKLIDEMQRFRDIRVIFNKATQSGTAFVEFATENEASRWVRHNRGMLKVSGEHLTMDLCKPLAAPKKDWICAPCGEKNHYARESCYSCQSDKQEADEKPRLRSKSPPDEYGRDKSAQTMPSNVLMIRGLDYRTTESQILRKLQDVGAVPIKDVRLITDKYTNKSRGFCFVEVSTVEEGKTLYTRTTKTDPPFDIGGRRVTISYQREPTKETNEAAESAIAAAQWSAGATDTAAKPAEETKDDKKPSNDMPDVIGSYVYDEKSGYYYDQSSGLYYDPKTKYYYNPTDQQYYFWDEAACKYQTVTNPDTNNTENKPSEDQNNKPVTTTKATKAMNAKKIQKDMERWAKAKNRQQAKANPAKPEPESPQPTEVTSNVQSGNSIALKIAQDYADPAYQSTQQPNLQQQPPPPSIFPIPNITQTPPVMLISDDDINRKHEDLSAMACLLCKRKFPSLDNLKRHQELSELHKTSLTAERDRAIEADTGPIDYRDRAQERRSKFGSEGPPNKYMRGR